MVSKDTKLLGIATVRIKGRHTEEAKILSDGTCWLSSGEVLHIPPDEMAHYLRMLDAAKREIKLTQAETSIITPVTKAEPVYVDDEDVAGAAPKTPVKEQAPQPAPLPDKTNAPTKKPSQQPKKAPQHVEQVKHAEKKVAEVADHRRHGSKLPLLLFIVLLAAILGASAYMYFFMSEPIENQTASIGMSDVIPSESSASTSSEAPASTQTQPSPMPEATPTATPYHIDTSGSASDSAPSGYDFIIVAPTN